MKGRKGFEPGVSGNPGGRKLGVPNKVARPTKEILSNFLNEKLQELPAIWEKLTPRDRANFIKDLLPFIVPKLSTVDMEADINFSSMSEVEIDAIAIRLLTNNKNTNEKND